MVHKWTYEQRQAAVLLCYDLDIPRAARKHIFDSLFGLDVSVGSICAMAAERNKNFGAPSRSPDWDRICASPQDAADKQTRERLVTDIQKIQAGQWNAGRVVGNASSDEEDDLSAFEQEQQLPPVEGDPSTQGAGNTTSQQDLASAPSNTDAAAIAHRNTLSVWSIEYGLPTEDFGTWYTSPINGGDRIELDFIHSLEVILFQTKLHYRKNRNLINQERSDRDVPNTVASIHFTSGDSPEMRQICLASKCRVCRGVDGNSNSLMSVVIGEERHWLTRRTALPSRFFELAGEGQMSFLTEVEQREMRLEMAAEMAAVNHRARLAGGGAS
jgi:hypothetical protein